MSATTQTPVVPPRPTKAQDMPQIPPRPVRRAVDRSLSPNRDRFAPSPLDSLLSKSPNHKGNHFPSGTSPLASDPIERTGSVDLPSVGQEGMEYAVAEELRSHASSSSSRAASPEQTRTIAHDLKLHAPKPSLPAINAKQRVAAVTHTDSEKAASFGIGHAGGEGSRKKSSIASQELSSAEDFEDDEQGIPEIGRQVPMYPNAGDVQAPSPAIVDGAADPAKKNHRRKKSGRGFGELPPGSYGLHGHGVIPTDKLEQAYYDKHPELARMEHTPHHADRAKDFSLPSADLNKIVHSSRGMGNDADHHNSTPSEQIGWQAIDESISRPASVALKGKSSSFGSQASVTPSVHKNAAPEISLSAPDDEVIHIDDPNRRKSVMFSEVEKPELEFDETEAPILASDELAKDTSSYDMEPAVEPKRRLSSFDGETSSRHSSRPASLYRSEHAAAEVSAVETTAEEEYEPLFKDETVKPRSMSSKIAGEEAANRFPSRDVWEDAPNSAHYTAEVNAPEAPAEDEKEAESASQTVRDVPPRHTETPAQAFARHQEELAEKELHGVDAFAENRKPQRPTSWAMKQPLVAAEVAAAAPADPAAAPASTAAGRTSHRPAMARFPSRDVWEDAPESLQLQTVVSNPQEEEVPSPAEPTKPEIPQKPARKMTDPSEKPPVSSRPKPQVPARPTRQQPSSASEESTEAAAPGAKPAVPARPVGGKIAQLQASFMSDLNKKLKIGPQAPKKEEPAEAEGDAAGEAEKAAPLADVRKGRARGPQRRAPQASSSPAPATAGTSALVTLGFSTTTTLYSIDPEEGVVLAGTAAEATPESEVAKVDEAVETKVDAPAADVAESNAAVEEEAIESNVTVG